MYIYIYGISGADQKILNRVGVICRQPWFGWRRNFYVSDGLKFLTKYFYQYFQTFSVFIYDESYQFLKIYKRFDKKRKQHSMSAASEKRKIKKKWTLFYSRLFYKAFKVISNHFYFVSSFAARFSIFVIRMMQKISKELIGNIK